MNRKERVFAVFSSARNEAIFVFLIGTLASLLILGGIASAAPLPESPHPPAIQAGTAVIYTGGSSFGRAYIDYDFPGNPVIVATLRTEIETQYLYADAFSNERGSIVVQLDAPTNQPIEVNWVATMATETAGTEGQ